jgi:hypothetical protein
MQYANDVCYEDISITYASLMCGTEILMKVFIKSGEFVIFDLQFQDILQTAIVPA